MKGSEFMKALKLFNGRDWDCRGGHLFIAAHSVKDCAELVSAAYRKVEGLENRLDCKICSVSEVNNYYSKGCWGNSMEGIVPERGVWWGKPNGCGGHEKPERIV